MNILITGGCGFIGSELIDALHTKNKIFVIDNLSTGYKSRIKRNLHKIKFVEGDINDAKKMMKIPKVDWVIHAAALSALPNNQINLPYSVDCNIKACASLVDWCLKKGVKKLIFLSTSAIYEKNKKRPFFEDKVNKPVLIYPVTKFLAENFFESISKSYPINIVSLRLSNIYGRNQDYFRKQLPFLGYLIKGYLLKKKLTFFSKGNHRRDYLFIDDLSNLITKIIKTKKYNKLNNSFEVFNVGSGRQYSVMELIKFFQRIINSNLSYSWGKKKNYWANFHEFKKNKLKLNKNLLKQEVEKIVILNIDKVKKRFNWKPNFQIQKGLKECLKRATEILALDNKII